MTTEETPAQGSPRDRIPLSDAEIRRLRTIEFVLFVAVVVGIVYAVTLGIGLVLSGSALGIAKNLMFGIGFLLFGAGAWQLRPAPAWKDGKRISFEKEEDTRLDKLVGRLPPLDGQELPMDLRVGRGAKYFVASLIILGTSFVMEVVLGIGASV